MAKHSAPIPPDDHHTLRTVELAGLIDRTPNTVRKLTVDGVIPAVKFRERYWFNYADVETALRGRKRKPHKSRQPHVYTPPDEHHTLGTAEVAEAIGCHIDTLKRWVRQGLVASVLHQGKRWFNLGDVRRSLSENGMLAAPLSPVQPTAPYWEHDLTVGRAAAQAGVTKAQLIRLADQGRVPYVRGEEGFRMFNIDDLRAALRSDPELLRGHPGRKVVQI